MSVDVTEHNTQDGPYVKTLIEQTTEHFHVARIFGDNGNRSYANLWLTVSKGAEPFIPLEEFLRAYRKRSNLESTFSAIKRVFGDAKMHVAQVNDVLLKVRAHNTRCLIHSMHELGISPNLPSHGLRFSIA